MAEWLFEAGLGESRAARIEQGEIVEAAIELEGTLTVGSIVPGRLTTILIAGRRGLIRLEGGGEALLDPLPAALTEGAAVMVEITREALPEAGRLKHPRCRLSDVVRPAPGPTLRERLISAGHSLRLQTPYGPDRLEEAGWSELLEEARSGEISFPGGALRMAVTPAMTLFDVDGALPPLPLAIAGVAAAGRAIYRLGIGGSIGIDLPTLPAKSDRQVAAAALDAALPQPFERTAVNGFGFLQIVRRRERPSIPELIQADPPAAAARALLRRAERAPGAGLRTLVAHPAVIAALESHADWLEALSARIGAPVALQAAQGRAISAGDVHCLPI